jgi:uncharacterized membrane protein YdbT with pleckstrin-like domain
MIKNQVIVAKTWRSEIKRMVIFVVLSVVSIFLTHLFPESVIEGKLLTLGSRTLMFALPLFWLLPVCGAGNIIFRIYNVRYVIDSRGIEAKVGILAMNQRITRVRFEDIRSVETEQTMLERILNIGDVEIGTAATGDIEIIFQGIAAPTEVQDMIQSERDRRHTLARTQRTRHYDQQATA